MKITIFGTGYVGLVTGVGLAHLGHSVICADISDEKINILNSGKIPIWEEGLEELLDEVRKENRIKFTTNIEETIKESDILFITVGTPSLPDGSADLFQLWSVVSRIAEHSNSNKLVIIKSTVPVGTSDEVELYLSKLTKEMNIQLNVASNPEFLRQGKAIYDFLNPDRIIVGTSDKKIQETISKMYKNYSELIQYHDRRSAEMIKYAANTFLAMKISYINMLAGLCEKLDANIENVAKGIGADERIGSAFLQAGVGYGGSCFPKDTQALLHLGKQHDYDLPLIEATININNQHPYNIVDKLKNSLGNLYGKKIALLGLTFKPKTDDLREAPSIKISRLLLEEGAEINAYDPVVNIYPIVDVKLYNNVYDALGFTDAIVIVTEWEEFKMLDWNIVSKIVSNKLVVDGRNMFPISNMTVIAQKYNITYFSVGRQPIYPILY